MTTLNNSYNQTITLTDEQEKCLNYHLDEKALMIKGYAGAGKSFVIQASAIKYINMYPEGKRSHKIGVFTYTNSLVKNMREFFDENPRGDDIYTSTLDKYLIEVYRAIGGPYIKLYDGKIRQDNIKQSLEQHLGRFGKHRFHDLSTQFWEEEIDWMKGMNVTPDDKEYYLSLPRKGRGSSVRMSKKDREVAFEIFCAYCELIRKKGCGDWADFSLYINKKLKEYQAAKKAGMDPKYPIPDEYMFDMILIDEAQDFSLAYMLAAMGLYRNAIIIAMDAHQRIYASQWSTVQLGVEAVTEWLRRSKRNTIEIDALAESLREKNDVFIGSENKERRAKPEDHGDKPIICGFIDSSEERSYVINQLKTWLNESKNIRIGIIGSTNKQVEKYGIWCTDAGIDFQIIDKDSTFSMKTPGVKILTVHCSKGMEFFRVLIPEFVEGLFPYKVKATDPDEAELELCKYRSIAYVAMTRAQDTLVISYSGKRPSRFIDEMDASLYEYRGTIGRKSGFKQSGVNTASRQSTNAGRAEATSTQSAKPVGSSLKDFFEGKGFECVDKRKKDGGSLWVIGSRQELSKAVREAESVFGDLGNNNFSEYGGRATNHRSAWFMTSDK